MSIGPVLLPDVGALHEAAEQIAGALTIHAVTTPDPLTDDLGNRSVLTIVEDGLDGLNQHAQRAVLLLTLELLTVTVATLATEIRGESPNS